MQQNQASNRNVAWPPAAVAESLPPLEPALPTEAPSTHVMHTRSRQQVREEATQEVREQTNEVREVEYSPSRLDYTEAQEVLPQRSNSQNTSSDAVQESESSASSTELLF